MYNFVVLLAILTVAVATPLKHWPLRRIHHGRIVGGNDTTIENVPYQISLHVYGSLYCGGSIISKEWIVTAGHCAGNYEDSYSVRAGSTNHDAGGSVHGVKEIIRHEDYGSNSGLPVNDIALMRVDEPFQFDETRQPISLFDESEHLEAGAISVITGWGNTLHGFPDILQLVEVPIVSKAECNENYLEVGGLPKNQICAAYPEGGKDACQGDSGGPLAIEGRLAGITSWGLGCAQAGKPGVYTEVAAYRSWIKKRISL